MTCQMELAEIAKDQIQLEIGALGGPWRWVLLTGRSRGRVGTIRMFGNPGNTGIGNFQP
jgi:hypothetical protein